MELDRDVERLTPREVALMRLVCAGLRNAEIANVLGRSEKTVRNQVTRVYAKLRATNRAHAVALFLRRTASDTAGVSNRDVRPIGDRDRDG